ncbi:MULTISPECIES: 3-hexulose-6-phosphate synthase [unclassified Breznakia]|uniref:3-hexulose-6-phosphate synthase n=1 Tax=unclassified Breznakia TaxID=2623764 RepID=UPI00240768CD|nr:MULTISPECIES: 3-hexulose-6-phosphate synthase [unclassified Breznakia]MDF9837065.1 3-hexulose-6-phosphate synthase [Breznakia sp. PFB2-8]MDF9858990.1 3-hexulose-6-phosphate synthase [Breznakia sp. PH5-24]
MKLQIAVDIADTNKVLEIAETIHDVIDIYEVGTPVIIKEGLAPVMKLKAKYPDLCVLADTKIVDGGAIECKDVCEAGADIVTVLALADNATIEEVVEVAHKYGRKVLADLICVPDISKRSQELLALGVDYVGVHTGVDMQKRGRTPLADLKTLVVDIESSKVAVAGGVNLDTVDSYAVHNPEIIISGGALYNAPDIRKAVMDMKGYMK